MVVPTILGLLFPLQNPEHPVHGRAGALLLPLGGLLPAVLGGVTPKASLNARLNTEKEVNPASMAMVVTGRSLRASSHFTRSSRVRRL